MHLGWGFPLKVKGGQESNLNISNLNGLEWCSKGINMVYILNLVKRVYYKLVKVCKTSYKYVLNQFQHYYGGMVLTKISYDSNGQRT